MLRLTSRSSVENWGEPDAGGLFHRGYVQKQLMSRAGPCVGDRLFNKRPMAARQTRER
jgi:hypothetical protein